MLRALYILFFLLITVFSQAQTATVYGTVLDENRLPFIPSANISILGEVGGTVTTADGSYKLKIPANREVVIRFSNVSYQPIVRKVNLKTGESVELNIILDKKYTFDTVNVVFIKDPEYVNIQKIEPKQYEFLPTSGDAMTSFIKRMPGVYSNNELSSQYSVRGGNFDENLIYVNGVEIFRPLLIRSGQQEGLGFVNSDLVKSIKFSTGGFDAIYGDKLSSVLDIEYKDPTKFAGSVTGSLLGGSFHLEGASKSLRFRYLTGLRYKTNQYILKALDTKGDYKPSFIDWQSYLAYDVNEYFKLSFLGNYSMNKYLVVPSNRETNFGNIYEALRFTVYFDGQEVDQFNSYMGAFTGTYAKSKVNLQFATSLYNTKEEETYDIMGQYWLGVLENDLGKDDFGQVVFNKGVGTFINHARNYLYGTIATLQHKGVYNENIFWGLEMRHDLFSDKISEWQMLDSAGFSLPHIPDNIGNFDPNYTPSNSLELTNVIKSRNDNVQSNRISAYFQKLWKYKTKKNTAIIINGGVRANFWDYNSELIISPRVNVSVKPKWKQDVNFRFAAGIYAQPPLYREMRNYDGSLNPNILAQKSAQILAGSELTFEAWDRPFKFTSELYYKYLWDLIPYEVNDVKVRYYADQRAIGYATGLDLKLFGELVKDAESWVGVSIMKTEEDIIGDFYIENGKKIYPGYIPRPTDQRINFNLFFQDYIPGYPSYKVHLNFVIGSGLPFGRPDEKFDQVHKLPAYRRVDIGFSKQLIGSETKLKAKNPFRHFKSMWVSIEVFNLLQISNTISYLWITDVTGSVYGIPNYLTPRQVNIKLHAKF